MIKQGNALLLASVLLAGCGRPATDGIAMHPSASRANARVDADERPTPEAPPSTAASLLAAQESVPAVRLPGLPDASGAQLDTGRLQPLPAELATVLTRATALEVPPPANPGSGDAYVIDLPQRDGRHEYLAADSNGSAFRYWIRSFSGTAPTMTGYLLQVRMPCQDVTVAGKTEHMAAAQQQCRAAGTEFADSGLRAYRVMGDHAPTDVTGELAPAVVAAVRELHDAYRDKGASDVFVDASRLPQVPVLRLVAEMDPEHPLPATATGAFDHGNQVHAGFVVWDGERFVYQKTVPAALWPCPPDKSSLCTKDDRFVTGKR